MTNPLAPPVPPVEALLKRWREEAGIAYEACEPDAYDRAQVYESCADELAAVIAALPPPQTWQPYAMKLRAALIGLVGASEYAELEQMEAVMRAVDAPAADKVSTIDAIHALLMPLPQAPSQTGAHDETSKR